MSFRDNLQHLRATRNMTQEQLAMLLGVSRQSVTKWEAEKSYPEMDKLLKMCQVFDCTLDDLVQGDLTARPKESAAASMPAGPVTDICGYDEHMVRFAKCISAGVPFFILGAAASVFVQDALPLLMFGTDALYDHEVMSRFEPFGVMALLAFILIGLALLIPAVMDHSSFVRAHPYVEDFYTEGQRTTATRQLAFAVWRPWGPSLPGWPLLRFTSTRRGKTARRACCLCLWRRACFSWYVTACCTTG